MLISFIVLKRVSGKDGHDYYVPERWMTEDTASTSTPKSSEESNEPVTEPQKQANNTSTSIEKEAGINNKPVETKLQ